MQTRDTRRNKQLTIEAVLAGAVVACFGYTLYWSVHFGYAVQPFIYNTFDTYMDWFNSVFWAWDPSGAYDNWGTVYAPFSFVLLRIFSIQSCYLSEPIYARDCDWVGRYTIYATYIVTVVVLVTVYRNRDKQTWIFRSICMALGLPLLFAFERGNFIMLATMMTVLVFSNLIKSSRLKWLICAIAINLKIYLISMIVGFFLKREWVATEQIAVFTVLVYIVSWATFGEGTPIQLFNNLVYFSSAAITGTWQDIYYPSSMMSLVRFIDGSSIPLKYLGSSMVETLDILVPVLVRAAQASVLLAFFAALLSPRSVPAFRLAALGIALAITTSESGGYAHAMVICLVLLEEWQGLARPLSLICCYAISLPADYVVSYVAFPNTFSWWAQINVLGQFGVGVGNIARPIFMLIIMYCLASLTIKDAVFALLESRLVVQEQ